MFFILPESHRIIAEKLYVNMRAYHNMTLNKEKLLWYSVAPDFLPQYKYYRHYRQESLSYVIDSIIQLIGFAQKYHITTTINTKAINEFSKKLGVVSHYLVDFVTMPHARRMTFQDAMIEHIQYEVDLNEYARGHQFDFVTKTRRLPPMEGKSGLLYSVVKNHIDAILEEYDQSEPGFEVDLNYAYDINCHVADFVLSCAEVPVKEERKIFALTPLLHTR